MIHLSLTSQQSGDYRWRPRAKNSNSNFEVMEVDQAIKVGTNYGIFKQGESAMKDPKTGESNGQL